MYSTIEFVEIQIMMVWLFIELNAILYIFIGAKIKKFFGKIKNKLFKRRHNERQT